MARTTAGPGEIRALSAQTNAAGIVRITSQLCLIVAMAVCIWLTATAWGVMAALPLMAVQGIFIAFLFMAVHETAHKTAFRTRWLNVAVGQICGVMILLPYEYYCLFHWDHHRHTQDPARDPELLTAPRVDSLPSLTTSFTGLLQVVNRVALLLRHAVTGGVTAPWVPEDKRRLVVREARAYTAIYLALAALSVAFASSILVWAWLVPLLIGQLFLRPYLFAEHTGCGHSRSALENTRTTYTNGIVRWFTWNMPFHAEHHAFPSVPFHALPRLNALLAAQIVHQGHGYRTVIPAAWRWLRLQQAQ